MAKLDVKSAYRMVPVHPQDHQLLGMYWDNKIYIDTRLPFGLWSATKIFSALARAMHCMGPKDFLHYLDDFLFMSPPSCAARSKAHLTLAMAICEELGFPIAPEKIEGPATCITFWAYNWIPP